MVGAADNRTLVLKPPDKSLCCLGYHTHAFIRILIYFVLKRRPIFIHHLLLMNFLTSLALKFRMDILFWTHSGSFHTALIKLKLRWPIRNVQLCPAFPHRQQNPLQAPCVLSATPSASGGRWGCHRRGWWWREWRDVITNQSLSIMQCNIDWNISIATYTLSFDNSPLCRPTERNFLISSDHSLSLPRWTDISEAFSSLRHDFYISVCWNCVLFTSVTVFWSDCVTSSWRQR